MRAGALNPISQNGQKISTFGSGFADVKYGIPSVTIFNNPTKTNWRICNSTTGWEATLTSPDFESLEIYIPNESCLDIEAKSLSAEYTCPSIHHTSANCNDRYYRAASKGARDGLAPDARYCIGKKFDPKELNYFKIRAAMLHSLKPNPNQESIKGMYRLPKNYLGNSYLVVRANPTHYKVCGLGITVNYALQAYSSQADGKVELKIGNACTVVEASTIWLSEPTSKNDIIGTFEEIKP